MNTYEVVQPIDTPIRDCTAETAKEFVELTRQVRAQVPNIWGEAGVGTTPIAKSFSSASLFGTSST